MQLKFKYLLWGMMLFPFLNACNAARSSQDSKASSGKLKVMTYNIHHANPPSKAAEGVIDLPAIANVINAAKPDLVALQEVDVHTVRSGVDVNEADSLASLTGMHYYFTRSIDYQGGAYGIAVLSRLPIVDSISHHLPIEEGTKEEIRSLCMIKVKLSDNSEIYFASTHLGLSKASRLLQAQKINDIVEKLSLPVIIGGDFNATATSETIKLLDQVMTRSCTTNCANTIPIENPSHKIDYIMYRPADKFSTIKQTVIKETYASDHLPVVVDLAY